MMQRRTFVEQALLTGAGGGLALPTLSATDGLAPSAVRMVGQPKSDHGRDFFALALAKLALSQQGAQPTFNLSGELTWQRQVRELHANQMDLAVLPAVQGAYDDFQMRRVDFPLRRGLLGIRLLVARRDQADAIGVALNDLASLKRMRLGYGSDWADRPWMAQAGLQLVLRRDLVDLFAALQSRDCDVLSRGINEVWWDLQRPDLGGKQLAVVPGVALFYPLDDCFYVSPEQASLHQLLSAGLRAVLRNGRYLALLHQYHHDDLARAQLSRRRVLTFGDYPVPQGLVRADYDVLRLLQGTKAKR